MRTAPLPVALLLTVPLLVGASAPATCAPADHPGGDWASYGRDHANTRHQSAEDVIGVDNVASLTPDWVISTEGLGGSGDITGTPVVAGGCMYIGSNNGWVFAVNADTGELVWRDHLPGMINGSVAVADGRVVAAFDFSSDTFLAAFDQRTGERLWRSPRLDDQTGSDIFGSPVIFEDTIFIGISGLAEVEDETTRYGFQGSFVLLDAPTGAILKKTWTIPEDEWEVEGEDVQDDELGLFGESDELGYSGGTIWSTPAVDAETKTAYVGAGNPFNPYFEHEHTNALLKVDLDRASATFGEIVGSYKGTLDSYVPAEATRTRCVNIPEDVVKTAGGFVESKACGEFDLDIGASPNIFTDADGRKLVGVGQKSGVYHAVDADTMEGVWESLVGIPSEVGGIVGSTAFDGEAIYGPHTVAGYLFRLEKEAGGVDWVTPVADGVHWGQPVASANGVVYTVDYKGFLDAYDAATGVPLLHVPMMVATHARYDSNLTDPVLSWAGVSVARNTVYAAIGVDAEGYGLPQLPNGYVVAYRPSADPVMGHAERLLPPENPERSIMLRRRTLPLLLAALCLPAVVAAGEVDPCTAPADQTDAAVTSFDGAAIAVTVFRPDGACATDTRPVILTLHGWAGSRSTDPGAADVAPFLEEGYGVVAIDARGHGESGGAALVHHPDREVRDFQAVLDWIAGELDWVTPEDSGIPDDVVAGAYGGSYGGGFQLMTAAFDDRLDALVPMATWNDLQQSLWPNRLAIKSDWLSLLYAAGETGATLDPALGDWFLNGMADNIPPHAAQDSFRESSPARWMSAIDVPTLLIQGLPDTLFNLNEAVHNYEGIRANGADVRLVGVNTGHLLPGLQPTALGHTVQQEDSPCGDPAPIVRDFLGWHLRGDAAAADRLAAVPRVLLGTEQDTCVSGSDWPLHTGTIEFKTTAIAAPEPAGSTLVPLLTADAPLTLAGIPRLTGTPLTELDDQLWLSLVVVDTSGAHIVHDQVTGVRFRAPGCGAARTVAVRAGGSTCSAAMTTQREIELGGIATTLEAGQQLFLRVDGWNEQSALNSTRRPGAAVMTNVTLELPVVPTPTDGTQQEPADPPSNTTASAR